MLVFREGHEPQITDPPKQFSLTTYSVPRKLDIEPEAKELNSRT
jgi:hypothetical protein